MPYRRRNIRGSGSIRSRSIPYGDERFTLAQDQLEQAVGIHPMQGGRARPTSRDALNTLRIGAGRAPIPDQLQGIEGMASLPNLDGGEFKMPGKIGPRLGTGNFRTVTGQPELGRASRRYPRRGPGTFR